MVDRWALSEPRTKHLEMIQAVIARLGNDSFLVKGWAVTVNGVFLGFAISAKEPWLAVVSTFPAVLFWSLDTYYLRSERLFRLYYERVRVADSSVTPFGMNATAPDFVSTLSLEQDRAAASYWKTAWRPTLRYLYGGLVIASVLVATVGPRDQEVASSMVHGSPHFISECVEHC